MDDNFYNSPPAQAVGIHCLIHGLLKNGELPCLLAVLEEVRKKRVRRRRGEEKRGEEKGGRGEDLQHIS